MQKGKKIKPIVRVAAEITLVMPISGKTANRQKEMCEVEAKR
jgi:hypothetical protein